MPLFKYSYTTSFNFFLDMMDAIIRELGSEKYCQIFRTMMYLLQYSEMGKRICELSLRFFQYIGFIFVYINVGYFLPIVINNPNVVYGKLPSVITPGFRTHPKYFESLTFLHSVAVVETRN